MYKGIVNDVRPEAQPEGTYRWALNKIKSKRFDALSDEYPVLSRDLLNRPEVEEFFVIGKIPLTNNDHAFLISIEGKVNTSEIGVLDAKGNYKAVLSGEFLDFKNDDYIDGVCVSNFDSTRTIIYTNGRGKLRMINVDNPGVDLHHNKSLMYPDDAIKFDFFPSAAVPNLYRVRVNDSGGVLLSGMYSFALQYEIEDSGFTNFVHVYNPIPVTDSREIEGFDKYDGCKAETVTSKSITLFFENLDKRYKRARLAVLKKLNSNLSAEIITTFDVPDSGKRELVYTGGETATPIPVEDITIGFTSFDKIDTLTFDGYKLWLAGLHRTPVTDGQQSANKIKSQFVYEDSISLNGVRGSYKDGATVFMRKSFLPDEVYAFYIAWKLHDGSYTPAYHIPGRTAETVDVLGNTYAENASIAEIRNQLGAAASYLDEDLLIASDLKYFHTRDTAKPDGTLGYWENKETYPEWFPDLAGQKVRHHKMPSLRVLNNLSDFVTNSLNSSLEGGALQISGGLNSVFPPEADFLFEGEVDAQYGQVNGHYFEFIKDAKLTIDYWAFAAASALNYAECSVKLVIRNSQTGELVRAIEDRQRSFTNPYGGQADALVEIIVSGNKIIDVMTGQKIGWEVEGYYLNDFKLRMQMTVSDLNSSLDITGTQFTKALGIKFSGIEIPESLRGRVQGFEIFYAKRTIGNSTVVSQSMLFGQKLDVPGEPTGTGFSQFRFHGPDLLANDGFPAISVSHIKRDFSLSQLKFHIGQNYTLVPDNYLHHVSSYRYTPHDTKNREAALLFYLSNQIDLSIAQIATLCSYKANVYSMFTEQDLVSTGVLHPASTLETPKIYGGDQHISVYGLRITPDEAVSRRVYSFVVFSAVNIGLRHDGTQYGELFYPKHSIPYAFGTAPEGIGVNDVDNFVAVNPDYTSLNEFNRAYPENLAIKRLNDFPHRIAGSPVLKSEGEAGLLRAILPGDYHDISKDRGEIVNIEAYRGELLIHTRNSLYKTVGKISMQTSSEDIVLGAGDIFRVPPDEVIASPNGFAGLKNKSAAMMTIYGYLFINSELGEIFLINEKVTKISNTGISAWLNKNIRLKAKDQIPQIENTAAPYSKSKLGFAIGVDSNNDRIIISKRDFTSSAGIVEQSPLAKNQMQAEGLLEFVDNRYFFSSGTLESFLGKQNIKISLMDKTLEIESMTSDAEAEFLISVPTKDLGWPLGIQTIEVFYEEPSDPSKLYLHKGRLYNYLGEPASPENTVLLKNESVCMSYNISSEKFISEHTRVSDHYLDAPSGMLELQGSKLIIPSQDGEAYESWVDIVERFPSTARLGAISWEVDDKEKTYGFTHLMVYNSSQCSGIIRLADFDIRRKRSWNFNQFADLSVDSSFLDENFRLIPEKIDHNKDWYDQKRFIDNYAIIRLINRNLGKNVLHLYTVASRHTVL